MWSWIVKGINSLIKGLGVILTFIFGILPNSPFTYLENSPIAQFLGIINYFVPISYFISVGEIWLTAIAIYYIYQTVLRWIKAIS
jgi:hypothetical protein